MKQKLSHCIIRGNGRTSTHKASQIQKMLDKAAKKGSMTVQQAKKVYVTWLEMCKDTYEILATFEGREKWKEETLEIDEAMGQMLIDKLCWYVAQPELAAKKQNDREM